MTTGEAAQVLSAVASMGAMLISAVGLLVSILNRQKIEKVATTVDQVHVATNGLVSKVGAAKLAQGDAEGHERGLQQGRDEIR